MSATAHHKPPPAEEQGQQEELQLDAVTKEQREYEQLLQQEIGTEFPLLGQYFLALTNAYFIHRGKIANAIDVLKKETYKQDLFSLLNPEKFEEIVAAHQTLNKTIAKAEKKGQSTVSVGVWKFKREIDVVDFRKKEQAMHIALEMHKAVNAEDKKVKIEETLKKFGVDKDDPEYTSKKADLEKSVAYRQKKVPRAKFEEHLFQEYKALQNKQGGNRSLFSKMRSEKTLRKEYDTFCMETRTTAARNQDEIVKSAQKAIDDTLNSSAPLPKEQLETRLAEVRQGIYHLNEQDKVKRQVVQEQVEPPAQTITQLETQLSPTTSSAQQPIPPTMIPSLSKPQPSAPNLQKPIMSIEPLSPSHPGRFSFSPKRPAPTSVPHVSGINAMKNAFSKLSPYFSKISNTVNFINNGIVKGVLEKTIGSLGAKIAAKTAISSGLKIGAKLALNAIPGVGTVASAFLMLGGDEVVKKGLLIIGGVILGVFLFVFVSSTNEFSHMVDTNTKSVQLFNTNSNEAFSWSKFEKSYTSYTQARGVVAGTENSNLSDWELFEQEHLLPQKMFLSFE